MLRSVSSEGIGRLCSLGKGTFIVSQVQASVTQVVAQTNPEARAGSASVLAEIYRFVGALAAGPTLQITVNVLSSLCADPHPLVHTWAIRSLASVISGAGLAYSSYAPGTLGMLINIYSMDTHEPDTASAGVVNLRGSMPVYEALGQVLDALVGSLGPEIDDFSHLKAALAIMLDGLVYETTCGPRAYAARALQNLVVVSPSALSLSYIIDMIRSQLASAVLPLRTAAITSIYQLVRQDVNAVSRLGGDRFVEGLFAVLDSEPSVEGVGLTIQSWISQTAASNPSGWVEMCERVLSKTLTPISTAPAIIGTAIRLEEEETAQLGQDAASTVVERSSGLRWQTQLFVLECLSHLIRTIRDSGQPQHFDTSLARGMQVNRKAVLLSSVGDLVRIAFSAATAPVTQVRLAGLTLLKEVIEAGDNPIIYRAQLINFV